MKKKIILGIIILMTILMGVLLLLIIPPIINKKYIEEVKISIYTNTKVKKIDDVYKDNNYYIVKIKDNVIVFDLNYDKVYTKEKIIDGRGMPLSFRRGKLYYKEKIRKKDKLIYNFYSTDDLSLSFTSQVGGI